MPPACSPGCRATSRRRTPNSKRAWSCSAGWATAAPWRRSSVTSACSPTLLDQCLTLRLELGDRPRVAECLELAAWLAAAQGASPRAARLFGAAEALRVASGAPMPPADRAFHERYLAANRAALDEPGFLAAFAAGRALNLEAAARLARTAAQPEGAGPASPRATPLTRRESEVATLIARGLSNRQIAAALVISERTAANHVEHILNKLGFN